MSDREPDPEVSVGLSELADDLPSQLRWRCTRLRDASNADRRHDEALHLLQDTVLALAGLAFADYRSRANMPSLKVEVRLMRWRQGTPWLTDYAQLLYDALNATPEPRLLPRGELKAVHFQEAARLKAILPALELAAASRAAFARPAVEDALEKRPRPISFKETLDTLVEFRNKAYAHIDRTQLDHVDDYLELVTPILIATAAEFLRTDPVATVLRNLRTARVISVDSWSPSVTKLEVRIGGRDGELRRLIAPEPAAEWESGQSVVLPRAADEDAAVRRYFDLTAAEDPPPPIADELVEDAVEHGRLSDALTALEAFLVETRFPADLDPRVVDDVIVMVLEQYKATADTRDYVLLQRAARLLDHQSGRLPPRITKDIEYFVSVTVERPPDGAGLRMDEQALIAQLDAKTLSARCAAIATLGLERSAGARVRLEEIASSDDRRAARKAAIYALSAIGDAASWTVVRAVASEDRHDPELAAHAFNALGGFATSDNARFLLSYISEGPVFPCTCSAAAAVARLAEEAPETVRAEASLLLDLIRNGPDPYTRGCLVFALSALGDKAMALELQSKLSTELNPFVAEDLCFALGRIGDEKAVPVLAELLEGGTPARDDPVVQRQAILALGRIGSAETERVLSEYRPAPDFLFLTRALRQEPDRNPPGPKPDPL